MTHTSARDSWTFTGKSGLVSYGVTALFFWVLVCARFCLCPPRVCPMKFYHQITLTFKVKFPGFSHSLCQIPRLGNLLSALELLKQWKNFFDTIVFQLVGPLLRGSVEPMATSSKGPMPHTTPPRSATARAPIPKAGHC